MRCYICDKVLSEPQFNTDHRSYDPCQTCLDVIQGVLDGYKDKPSMDEDDFYEEISLELPIPHTHVYDDY